jgi:hypothetical protein
MSTIVKKGKIAADRLDSYVVSVLNTIDMDNGSQVVLGAPLANQLGIYACTAPVDVTKDNAYVVLSPVIPKLVINGVQYKIDVTDPTLFTNVANEAARAFQVAVGDELTITAPGFAGTPVVGEYVVPANGVLTLAPAADLTGLTAMAYSVIALESVSLGMSYVSGYRIRCIKSVA